MVEIGAAVQMQNISIVSPALSSSDAHIGCQIEDLQDEAKQLTMEGCTWCVDCGVDDQQFCCIGCVVILE